jgi:hypothetical protein
LTTPQRAHKSVIDRARKVAGNAIHKSMLQAAGSPIALPQFDGNEHQDTLDKNWLAGGSDMPDGLLGIPLAPQIVGFAAAAGLHGPEIDPGDHGRIAVLAGEGAKCRKIAKAIDNERIGSFSGHS